MSLQVASLRFGRKVVGFSVLLTVGMLFLPISNIVKINPISYMHSSEENYGENTTAEPNILISTTMATIPTTQDADYATQTNTESAIREDKADTSMNNQEMLSYHNTTEIKKILFWNPWYHRTSYGFGLGQEPFFANNCPEKRCSTTRDLADFEDADAVVICGRLLNWENKPVVPPRRDPNQVYVYFNREAPVTQLGNNHLINNIFNITMTYRLDSTIPFPYSIVKHKTDHSNLKPVTLADIKDKSRTNPISWMVSRCHKAGCVRYEYAIHLSRYIKVDIYGRCGNLKCPRGDNSTCMLNQERQYKFYLAFENTVCSDYVTEKAFRTLTYNIVPIVMGGANYTKILPPHSFIDVRDFRSPEHLASYLQMLVDDDEEYLKYFEWKENFEIKTVPIHEPFCKLCELLHTEKKFLEEFDLEEWWDTKSGETCIRDDYRTILLKYFNVDPSIDILPRTHAKLLKLKGHSR